MKKAITTTTILTFSALVLIAISIFAYRIISSSAESKNRQNSYVEQCCINATEYVKEKYGFEAKIISSMYPTNSNYSHSAYINMEYNDKRFYVYITGEEKSTDGYDNYQAEEIKNSLNQKLIDITGIQHEALVIDYGMYDYHSKKLDIDYLVSDFFDGNNLNKVLIGINTVYVIYINQDTAEIPCDELVEQTGIYRGTLFNFNNAEQYHKLTDPSAALNSIRPDLRYVNDYRVLTNNVDEYHTCIKAEYDGVIVVSDEECSYLTIEEGNSDPAHNWNGHGVIKAAKVSKTYALNTDSENVYIYFPLKNIRLMPSEASFAAQYKSSDDVYYYCNTSSFDLTDDQKYAIFKFITGNREDISFLMLIDVESFI